MDVATSQFAALLSAGLRPPLNLARNPFCQTLTASVAVYVGAPILVFFGFSYQFVSANGTHAANSLLTTIALTPLIVFIYLANSLCFLNDAGRERIPQSPRQISESPSSAPIHPNLIAMLRRERFLVKEMIHELATTLGLLSGMDRHTRYHLVRLDVIQP